MMARETHTPIPYWLALPLGELFSWVEIVLNGGGKSGG